MRSDRDFVQAYGSALADIDPSSADLDGEALRTLAQTELCLAFVSRFIPGEPYRSVPFLMMGYPSLLVGAGAETKQALTTVRHLCSRFGSVSAWVDATVQYGRTPEILRCFDLRGAGVTARPAAPLAMRSLLAEWLFATVPWTERKLRVADPGEATVLTGGGQGQARLHGPPSTGGAARRPATRPRPTCGQSRDSSEPRRTETCRAPGR